MTYLDRIILTVGQTKNAFLNRDSERIPRRLLRGGFNCGPIYWFRFLSGARSLFDRLLADEINYILVPIECKQKRTVQIRCVVLRVLTIWEWCGLCLNQEGWHGSCCLILSRQPNSCSARLTDKGLFLAPCLFVGERTVYQPRSRYHSDGGIVIF